MRTLALKIGKIIVILNDIFDFPKSAKVIKENLNGVNFKLLPFGNRLHTSYVYF